MLSYNNLKILIKSRGLVLSEVAELLNYEYSGFVKAVKNDSLRHDARQKLAEIQEVSLAEINGEKEKLGSDPDGSTGGDLIERLDIYRKLTKAYEKRISELEARLGEISQNKN